MDQCFPILKIRIARKVFTLSLNSSCHLSSLDSLPSSEGHSFPDTLSQKKGRVKAVTEDWERENCTFLAK